MDLDKRRQEWEVWGAAIVVSLAVIAGLFYRGINGETVADAVKDVGAAVIPILAAFVAARLVIRQMDPAERFSRAGEAALEDLQKRHADVLAGPKANKEDYDSENPGKAGRYLFFQMASQGRKAQFIPVLPLKQGVVEIRVPKTTLLQVGFDRDGLEQAQLQVLASVRSAVEKVLQRDWPGVHEILTPKHPDIAIAVDLDETGLGPKRYRQAVAACGTAALEAVLSSRR
jgi:hypothetical protein